MLQFTKEIKANLLLFDSIKRYDRDGVTLNELIEFKEIIDNECLLTVPQLLDAWHDYHASFTSVN